MLWGKLKLSDIESAVYRLVNTLFNSHKLVANFEWMNSYGTDQDAPWERIAPFTQMIWDNAVAIGCSILRDQTYYHIFCVYSSGNNKRETVYEISQIKAGLKCEKGISSKYSGLCSENEAFIASDSSVVRKWIYNEKKPDRSTWNVLSDKSIGNRLGTFEETAYGRGDETGLGNSYNPINEYDANNPYGTYDTANNYDDAYYSRAANKLMKNCIEIVILTLITQIYIF